MLTEKLIGAFNSALKLYIADIRDACELHDRHLNEDASDMRALAAHAHGMATAYANVLHDLGLPEYRKQLNTYPCIVTGDDMVYEDLEAFNND